MSMWLEDIVVMETGELEGLCEELEMKLEEGRRELTIKLEMADVHDAAMSDEDD